MTKQLNTENNKEGTIEFPKQADNESGEQQRKRTIGKWHIGAQESGQVMGNSQVTKEIM